MRLVILAIVALCLLVSCGDGQQSAVGTVLSKPNLVPARQPGHPAAYAYCMPHQGWAPLKTYFSPFGSEAEEGHIVRYEWDLDGDGVFEVDATDANGYTQRTYKKAGEYIAALRVTDNRGRSSSSSVIVHIRDPQKSTVDYWTIFDDSKVQRIDLRVAQEDWDYLWEDIEDRREIEADAVIFGKWVFNVGLSMKGNGSLFGSGDKKSFKIDTNEYAGGQEYKNLKMLLLHNNFMDPSLLREKMAYDMLRFAGAWAGHVSYVELWIDIRDDDGPPIYWGVYSMVERVDKKYLANRFGQGNKYGNLYKGFGWFEEGAADLVYYGEDVSNYPHPGGDVCYQKETNKGNPDYSDVINLCRVIDGTGYASPGDFATALEKVFNVDSYLRFIAAMVVCDNWDIYPFCANNYYIYNNPGKERFEWIAWDMNSSWSGEVHRELFREEWGGPVDYAPLHVKVFEVPEYRRAYLAYVDLLNRYWFHPDILRKRAENLHNLISPYVKKATGDKMFFGDTALFPVYAFDSNWEREAQSINGEMIVGITRFSEERWHYLNEVLNQALDDGLYRESGGIGN